MRASWPARPRQRIPQIADLRGLGAMVAVFEEALGILRDSLQAA